MGLRDDVVLQARAARQGHFASLRILFLPTFGGGPFSYHEEKGCWLILSLCLQAMGL